jgi:hypothetical protein
VAKTKAKRSAAQRDKNNIAIAVQLKKAGILSKQAKLHSGAYISKDVLRKVRAYQHQAALGYKAYEAPKAVVRAAKERGYQTIGGTKIIGPKSDTFRKRLAKGEVTGIKPVRGGFMEEVTLPHDVYDMRTLIERLDGGIDSLKLPEEQFAFKYHGAESYRAFLDTRQMLDYLRHYKGAFDFNPSMKPEDLQEEFDNFTIFRLHPNAVDLNIRGARKRREDKKAKRMAEVKAGTYVAQGRARFRKPLSEKLAEMPAARANRIRAKMAKESQEKRAALVADPAKLADYRAKAKARSAKSRNSKKVK